MLAKLDENRNVVTCSLEEWTAWVSDNVKRGHSPPAGVIVAQFERGKTIVSTVFTGTNQGRPDAPKWFETQVFGDADYGYTTRYETWAEAEAGHKEVVDGILRAAIETPTHGPGSK
jgi:hypothetical protein